MRIERPVSYVDEAIVSVFGPVTLVEVTYAGPLSVGDVFPRRPGPGVQGEVTFLVRTKDVGSLQNDPVSRLESLEKVSILSKDGLEWLSVRPLVDPAEGIVPVQDMRAILEAGVDVSLLVRVREGRLYPLESELPLSTVYRWDYVGGVSDDEFDMERSQRSLEASPWVVDMVRTPVPDYMIDETYMQEYWDLTILLPQWTHDALVEHFRAEDPQWWSTKVPDALLDPPSQEWDLLQLGQARLSARERTEREQRLDAARS